MKPCHSTQKDSQYNVPPVPDKLLLRSLTIKNRRIGMYVNSHAYHKPMQSTTKSG